MQESIAAESHRKHPLVLAEQMTTASLLPNTKPFEFDVAAILKTDDGRLDESFVTTLDGEPNERTFSTGFTLSQINGSYPIRQSLSQAEAPGHWPQAGANAMLRIVAAGEVDRVLLGSWSPQPGACSQGQATVIVCRIGASPGMAVPAAF